MNLMSNVIDAIKEHEGFNGSMYYDTMNNPTIGYGTLLPLSENEATLLLMNRLNKMIVELHKREPFIASLPDVKKEVIYNMAYNLGVNGVLNFKKMFDALRRKDYVAASGEMLDSRWARQVGRRAIELAEIMRNEPK